jgi:hypothetical protein
MGTGISFPERSNKVSNKRVEYTFTQLPEELYPIICKDLFFKELISFKSCSKNIRKIVSDRFPDLNLTKLIVNRAKEIMIKYLLIKDPQGQLITSTFYIEMPEDKTEYFTIESKFFARRKSSVTLDVPAKDINTNLGFGINKLCVTADYSWEKNGNIKLKRITNIQCYSKK